MFKKNILLTFFSLLFLNKNLILTNYNQIGPKLLFLKIEPKNGGILKNIIPNINALSNNPKEVLQTFGIACSQIDLDKIISSNPSLGSNSPSNQGSPSFCNKK